MAKALPAVIALSDPATQHQLANARPTTESNFGILTKQKPQRL
jgi:UDP-N-acetylglucosamine:LPS N-acetylglucosamine transferase